MFVCICCSAFVYPDQYPDALCGSPPPPHHPLLVVSFITHSMGGLVLRSALHSPLLAALKGEGAARLGIFIPLACPHLGTRGGGWMSEGGVNPLVRGGVWALSNKYKCLREMGGEEEGGGDKVNSSLIYTLSLCPADISPDHPLLSSPVVTAVHPDASTSTSATHANGATGAPPDLLASFARVVVVSSPEDQYVPAHSASLLLPPSMRGAGMETVEGMGRRVVERLGGVGGEKLVRIYILNYPAPSSPIPIHMSRYGRGEEDARGDGSISSKGGVGGLLMGGIKGMDVDVLIGRKAHIVYAENVQVVRQLVYTLAPFFYALDHHV